MLSKFSILLCGLIFVLSAADPASAQDQNTVRVVPKDTMQITLSFADVVEASSPSVVNIYAKRRTKRSVPLFNDPFFQHFFQGFGLQTERKENSLGSGGVVDSSGLIISNLHVLKGAEDIVVVTHDHREYQAEIVLEDDKTDLAVIRLLNFSGTLPSLIFGDVYKARVGDLVLAIGNPFGVAQTVTSGIISGLARTQVNDNLYQSFIQTDAAINPGNSGGALINTRGELLGINTAIISPTGSSSGLGFAIPVNLIRPVVYTAKNDIPLNRAWLGFTPEPVDAATAEALGLSRPHGVLVGTILSGSPADEAGLQSGDLIVAADGNPIENPSNLRFFIATLIPENTPEIRFTLYGDSERDVRFPILFPPDDPPLDRRVIKGRNILSGAVVVNISPFITEYYGLPLGERGVLIQEVYGNSLAQRLGFESGDILRRLNKEPVSDVAMLVGFIDTSSPEQWLIEVTRKGETVGWQLR